MHRDTLDRLANASRRALAPALALAMLTVSTGASAAEEHSGWSWNFTPVLLPAQGPHRFGGGVDPEVRYNLDQGRARLSVGLRVGGYYANDLLGVTTMPTVRITVPIGPVEPYASLGMGYGWLPRVGEEGVAAMARLGFIIRFSEKLACGIEGTLQDIVGTDFRFPSIGSMLSFDL